MSVELKPKTNWNFEELGFDGTSKVFSFHTESEKRKLFEELAACITNLYVNVIIQHLGDHRSKYEKQIKTFANLLNKTIISQLSILRVVKRVSESIFQEMQTEFKINEEAATSVYVGKSLYLKTVLPQILKESGFNFSYLGSNDSGTKLEVVEGSASSMVTVYLSKEEGLAQQKKT